MGSLPRVPFNFLALPPELSSRETSRAILLPVPYDSTTSFRSGTRYGPKAILEASYNLEDYDLELSADVSRVGIYTGDPVEPHMGGPAMMVERVYQTVTEVAGQGRLVGVLGGEHSVSVGAVRALREVYPDLSVLFLDAHADLRNEYMGTTWGHASVARRIHEMCPLVLVGTRTLSQEERDYLDQYKVPTFFWPPGVAEGSLEQEVVELLTPHVYVSLDLDVLDPSIMAAVGTPEPGGMDWWQVTGLLKRVAESYSVVGFDVCELSPEEGPPACSYLAAKLVYKLIAYSLLAGGRAELV